MTITNAEVIATIGKRVELPDDSVLITYADDLTLDVMVTNLWGDGTEVYVSWRDEDTSERTKSLHCNDSTTNKKTTTTARSNIFL